MNTFKNPLPKLLSWALVGGLLCVGQSWTQAQYPARLQIRPRAGGEIELSFAGARPIHPNGVIIYQLQESQDFQDWFPVGEYIRSTSPDELHLRSVAMTHPQSFYRVLSREDRLGVGGGEVFGYSDCLAQELGRIGEISADQFAALHPAPSPYLDGISFDPRTARFWPEFNADPAEIEGRYRDYRLNAAEVEVLSRHGFVVSERLAASSFGQALFGIWTDDLPVFISTDAILQAWHRSYDAMLEEFEETFLLENLDQILDGMAVHVVEAASLAGDGILRDGVRDADYFLAVARTLLKGEPMPSLLGQNDRVAATLRAVEGLQFMYCFDLFGARRDVDFSQFKVRGHYENSERLGRYFQCVMWLGRVDFRIAGGPYVDCCDAPPHMAPPRELAAALVLNWLLVHGGQFERWRHFEQVIQTFVGWTDSMTFAQMGDLLEAAQITSFDDVADLAALERLQDAIAAAEYGVQNIRSDNFYPPLKSEKARLPRSFTVFGQKFVPDSWVLSQVVWDSIQWNEQKVTRRVPSCLDVAFSVLANDHIVPDLVARMTGTSPWVHPWRDGYNYQHNLAALRAVMDLQEPTAWESNFYMDWLGVLRELSQPLLQDDRYPEAMRTRAWAMKSLNTQMASWSQLRHDTILYAKQSYTPGGRCLFPEGFVEPVPHFWRRLAQLLRRGESLIAALPVSGTATVRRRGDWENLVLDLDQLREAQEQHLHEFAAVVDWLADLSDKELARQPWSETDRQLLNSMIEEEGSVMMGCWGIPDYDGWYPRLFYRPAYAPQAFTYDCGALHDDLIVADVHTDLPDFPTRDPGCVLHQALGSPNMLFLVADCAGEKVMFAGPVLSHHEFELVGPPVRLSDTEWADAYQGYGGSAASATFRPAWRTPPASETPRRPPPPPWTSSYLVPAY